MLHKIEANSYNDNPEQINKDLERVVKNYKDQAKGQNKG